MRNKRKLYESIMKDVSKIVKRHLTEEQNILEIVDEKEKNITSFLKENDLIQIIYDDYEDNKFKLYLMFILKEIFKKQNKRYQLFNEFTESRKDFLNNIQSVKSDIIIIEDNGQLEEQLKLLQDLFDTIDLPFSQIILLSTDETNSLKDYVQKFNEPCNFKALEL